MRDFDRPLALLGAACFWGRGEFQLVLPTSPGEPRAATCVISFSKARLPASVRAMVRTPSVGASLGMILGSLWGGYWAV